MRKDGWKKLLTLLKEPPKRIVCVTILSTVVFVALALTFVFVEYTGVFSYVAYAFAAITLGYSVYLVVRLAPRAKAWASAQAKRTSFTKNLTEDYGFRTLVFAICSFVINLGFVAFNTAFAFLTGNAWYGSLAGYYLLLSGLRGGVFWGNLRAKRKAKGEEEAYRDLQRKNYGVCGGALLALDVAMSVAVAFMVLGQKPTKYTEITAIVFATYSVYKISLAIWNIFKAKKSRDWQIQAFRNVGLVDAAVSLLSLQTTLVSTFSTDGSDMTILNVVVGGAVCLVGVGMGILMMIQAFGRRKYE